MNTNYLIMFLLLGVYFFCNVVLLNNYFENKNFKRKNCYKHLILAVTTLGAVITGDICCKYMCGVYDSNLSFDAGFCYSILTIIVAKISNTLIEYQDN